MNLYFAILSDSQLSTQPTSHSRSIDVYEPIAKNPAINYLISLQSKRSRQTMKSFLNIISKKLGTSDLTECPWHKIKRQHIHAVIESLLHDGRSPATVNTYLAAVKGVMLEAWTMKLIDTDTYQHIQKIKSIRGSRVDKGRSLTSGEITQLFQTIEKDKTAKGLRDAAIVATLLGCGLRRSELVTLNIQDVEKTTKTIVILGKGNKQRRAFVPDSTWKYISDWIEEIRGNYSGPLFTRIRRFDDVTFNRISDQAIYHILQTRQVEADIHSFAPHDLRRTFASMMLANGEDIVTVKDAMGHASVTTTQRYDRRGDERLRRASQRIIF
ncbi:MAG: Tyrosine recombinase XerC [Candidatus Celerinatantimonas neptuna]|nr:MAG: Tyrosine recombinase XerC [Candidatus Celerinatantimonas neptuna]